jgi:hypothetical protein
MSKISEEWRLFKTDVGTKVGNTKLSGISIRRYVYTDDGLSFLSVEDGLDVLSGHIKNFRKKAIYMKDQEIPYVKENTKEVLNSIKESIDRLLKAYDKDILEPEEVTAMKESV